MRGSILALASLLALAGCEKAAPQQPPSQRVTLVQKGPALIELLPAAGQPPYCLVFTIAEGGPIRHLTMLEDKLSPDCPAGEPIAGNVFRIPPREGKVKIFVVFSDRALESDPIGRQISDLVSQKQPVTAMDLRAPGRVVVETLEFTPASG
ncbi:MULTISPECIES: hypothetical protein [Polyangium]|uniref:Lipoprotein n=2 Tax=Polyangium TaxID=55 RepID=A0A4U1JEA5_9BACT|nr:MULTISPECIES: hypothetical protein [Polyangium]MDI1436335.1 hypothetical protein [Polyangium sorediatum]TKD09419.1 hypothetical protein E8A74_11880 [Polyangium fumosum]